MIYIANGVNSYSVNPFTYTERGKEIAQFERDLYSKPFRICDTVKEAIAWSYELLDT